MPLLFSLRGAPLGVPAVDDYVYLYAWRFRPLTWFDSMGSPFYWRPFGRQLYFQLMGPWLLDAPWVAALFHIGLLLAIALGAYAIARRIFAPPVAAAVGAFPLLAEPSRVLVDWPSGGEYLFALLGAVLAIDSVLRRRRWLAAAATLFALLSHESAVLLLAAIPLVGWARSGRIRDALSWLVLSLGVLGLWVGGHAIARTHGVRMPAPGFGTGFAWTDVPGLWLRGLRAQLNLEELPRTAADGAAVAYAALAILVVGFLVRRLRERATRDRARWLAVGGGVLWFLAGMSLLAFVLPDWSSWRTAFPALGLAFALVGVTALASPWLALSLVALRAFTLVLSLPAPMLVEAFPPPSVSHFSFTRTVRLQRTVDSTRRVLIDSGPALPRGAAVSVWSRAPLTEVAFEGADAVRVWCRDSTVSWSWTPPPDSARARIDALLCFNVPARDPAVRIALPAFEALRSGNSAMTAERWADADSFFALASAAQPVRADAFLDAVVRSRARAAYALGRDALADSLNEVDWSLAGESDAYREMRALLEARSRGHR